MNVAELVEQLKGSSSKWLKTQSPDLDVLTHYIDAQQGHHRKQTFQEEFRAFLKRYGAECDERNLWD